MTADEPPAGGLVQAQVIRSTQARSHQPVSRSGESDVGDWRSARRPSWHRDRRPPRGRTPDPWHGGPWRRRRDPARQTGLPDSLRGPPSTPSRATSMRSATRKFRSAALRSRHAPSGSATEPSRRCSTSPFDTIASAPPTASPTQDSSGCASRPGADTPIDTRRAQSGRDDQGVSVRPTQKGGRPTPPRDRPRHICDVTHGEDRGEPMLHCLVPRDSFELRCSQGAAGPRLRGPCSVLPLQARTGHRRPLVQVGCPVEEVAGQSCPRPGPAESRRAPAVGPRGA